MKNKMRFLDMLPFVMLSLIGAQAVVTGALGHPIICFVELGLMLVIALFVVLFSLTNSRRARLYADNIIASAGKGSDVLTQLGVPVMAVSGGVIRWYNSAFLKQVANSIDCVGRDVNFIVSEDIINSSFGAGTDIEYMSRRYRFYACNEGDMTMCYFIDTTELAEYKTKYRSGRPVVVYITVDNIDDLHRGVRDSEKTRINSAIEKRIENWASEMDSVFRRLSNDRYLLITDETGMDYMRDTRFDILNKVKSIELGDNGSATLSIGVGRAGEGFAECEELARQALDMALGRGGDQAAVRNTKEFEFFGGTSSTGSKRSKVRTRMVASSLVKLIDSCENVILMGHRYADLDSFGACYGFYRAVVAAGKQCRIAITRDKCLCSELIDYIEKAYPDETIIVSPEEAKQLVTKRTLVILADTHRATFADVPELLDTAQSVVVIDHHRKTVDHISNAVIFYHDPYASSACEMVSELLQYMTARIGKVEAEALLSGIMLDTRNFVLHTGVRTFESSAYLRGCGADPVVVRGFFQSSIEVYKLRAGIVSSAKVFDDCAVAVSEADSQYVRLASAQAADEMLGIEGVDASFVAFKDGDTVNISARSLGKVNVQLIMEKLGGGGHMTMAAAQLKDITQEQAVEQLLNAIKQYREENKQN